MDSHWGSCLCLAWLADGTFVAHKTVHCTFTTFPNILGSIGTGPVPFLAVSLVDYFPTVPEENLLNTKNEWVPPIVGRVRIE